MKKSAIYVEKLKTLHTNWLKDKQPHTLPLAPIGELEWLIKITPDACLDSGRRPESLKGTSVDTGRTIDNSSISNEDFTQAP